MRVVSILLGGLCLAFATILAFADPADRCAKAGNDDTLRPYERSMRPEFVRAFKRLFPDAKGAQSDAMLKAQGAFRCMDGKLVACFTGANLPCGKIDRARANPGAADFCRANPGATDVPLAASGHDSEFNWRCRNGRAEIAGTAWALDTRGFARDLWTPLD